MSITMMGVLIGFVSEITGLTAWSQLLGPYFILNGYTGPGVMVNFILIIVCIGSCMALLYKAFTMDDGSEIPI
jgi:hypothetical protein